jgi:hypothetical protein
LDRYTNLQIIETSSTTFETLTTNAGAASVDGIETDISLAPVDWLTVGVKYDSDPGAGGGFGGQFFQCGARVRMDDRGTPRRMTGRSPVSIVRP